MMRADEKTLQKYFDKLWPLCRSISGNGVRESLKILSEIIPFKIHEVPSGKKVFDWEIPAEWNISDAYIIAPDGKKIADFKKNNLHVVSYSSPVDSEISYEELIKHTYYIEDLPDAIPYRTTYYKYDWGFCLSFNEFKKLPETGKYKVHIDSTLVPGNLTYADLTLPGKVKDEIFFSTYTCHPSMANNELSGMLVLAFLYSKIASLPDRKYTYRFVFAPETIGAVNYLFQHGRELKKNMKAGYIVTCVGDPGNFNYKQSRAGNTLADRAAIHVLKNTGHQFNTLPFRALGSDERQYGSPGFNLPVGSVLRTPYHQYKEYHTSLDNKDFISFKSMLETIEVYFKIVKALELNDFYFSTNPYCEPQLGKRGLYPQTGGIRKHPKEMLHMMQALNFSDGNHDLIEIAEMTGDFILDYEEVVKKLINGNLLSTQKTNAWKL